ncbi:hypothetical protein BAUCODRAFT_151162 [Baudoinia panamericana UAMH 10762]|uniref:enoyl-[acyl-carrier-protein] reductase n=1 Tax=Baudoinia panamericana (strain UAMH 10762) TaxID=717646 RepID=M2M8M8_BAUPA|nr:uncharacterized protein BAUCODRAFT_151162 [Baudoinia panamericana UAMH 10762]EMC92751.1 hypothetical protein BAUCODRAFT_151162 [Baudoinia panamericana UAMH 10762]
MTGLDNKPATACPALVKTLTKTLAKVTSTITAAFPSLKVRQTARQQGFRVIGSDWPPVRAMSEQAVVSNPAATTSRVVSGPEEATFDGHVVRSTSVISKTTGLVWVKATFVKRQHTMAPSRAFTTAFRRLASVSTILQRPQHRCISAYGYEQAKVLAIQSLGEPKDVLHLHGHSISPPHGDLLTVRFLASPINPADINQIQGVYPTKPTFTTALGTSDPIAVGGNEGVAEIIAAGSGVKGMQKGDWGIMKKQGFGTWRTHAQCKADELMVVKDKSGLKPEQVGTVSVNPMTAYRMLKDFVRLKEGEWFVQNGANSGVGRAAIQLARLWGYKSLNIVRRREQGMAELKKDLKSLGADAVVTDEEVESKGFRDQVKELTNGGREPIRLGLNCVGGSLVNSMAKHLAPSAHMVTYGAMSKQPVSLPTGLLIFKDIHFDGFWVSKWSNENPEQKEACVSEVLDLTRQGKFKDVPMQPVTWDYDTKQDELVQAVQGTLEGFRSGKGIFVFGKT